MATQSGQRNLQVRGVVSIVPTPFTPDDQVDWPALRDLVDFAFGAGICAVCLPAYASEFYKLSEEEREKLVVEAVGHAGGRIPVIAQVNYPSSRQAAEAAVRSQRSGAAAVNVAVPRLFPLSDRDLYRHFDRILSAIDVPLIIQDFNPGGPTLSARFIASLHKSHPHFRWVKLEEPLMGAKVKAILEETSGEVGVLEGWGGMYMLELIPAGICGIVPGLALADILALVFRLAVEGDREKACEVFQNVLPQIVYSLQNLELLHHAEKLLLHARGVLRDPVVREARLDLGTDEAAHLDFLNGRVLALLDRLGMPRNPAAQPSQAPAS